MAKRPGSTGDSLWYKGAVIYELHVRAFKGSNGDGTGDFPGLIQKLDYLPDLGVTCLWLLPFFPSSLKDDGYDISDYMNAHSMCGTMDDFRAFLTAAHERDLQVMIELVVNHTSDQHPWFQAARQAPDAQSFVCISYSSRRRSKSTATCLKWATTISLLHPLPLPRTSGSSRPQVARLNVSHPARGVCRKPRKTIRSLRFGARPPRLRWRGDWPSAVLDVAPIGD